LYGSAGVPAGWLAGVLACVALDRPWGVGDDYA